MRPSSSFSSSIFEINREMSFGVKSVLLSFSEYSSRVSRNFSRLEIASFSSTGGISRMSDVLCTDKDGSMPGFEIFRSSIFLFNLS